MRQGQLLAEESGLGARPADDGGGPVGAGEDGHHRDDDHARQRVPHPALESEKEYFAELMESYFLVNDHYPFICCELKDQDPVGYALIAGLWEGNPRR